MTDSTRGDWLRRRNALWQRLRALPPTPDTPEFEAAVAALSALTGWDRARILAGLGLPPGTPAGNP
ncbi:hypothetical protein [Deinococcus depolymerans]|uniref:Uncharacterized protein n=1 Tax=Deinococcus depolymerans TaxID=392408 RepID=A0ABN1BSV7_9DEIO